MGAVVLNRSKVRQHSLINWNDEQEMTRISDRRGFVLDRVKYRKGSQDRASTLSIIRILSFNFQILLMVTNSRYLSKHWFWLSLAHGSMTYVILTIFLGLTLTSKFGFVAPTSISGGILRSSSEASHMSGLISQQLKGIPENGFSQVSSRAPSHHQGSDANSGHSSDDCSDEAPLFNIANGNHNIQTPNATKKVRNLWPRKSGIDQAVPSIFMFKTYKRQKHKDLVVFEIFHLLSFYFKYVVDAFGMSKMDWYCARERKRFMQKKAMQKKSHDWS